MFLEGRGVATATVVTHVFHRYAAGLARMQGYAGLPLIVLEHPVTAQPPERLRERVRRVRANLLDALVSDRHALEREPA